MGLNGPWDQNQLPKWINTDSSLAFTSFSPNSSLINHIFCQPKINIKYFGTRLMQYHTVFRGIWRKKNLSVIAFNFDVMFQTTFGSFQLLTIGSNFKWLFPSQRFFQLSVWLSEMYWFEIVWYGIYFVQWSILRRWF